MDNKGFYYFAHPYTCRDSEGKFVPEAEDANFQLCNQRAARLMEKGYNIYSPISHTHPIHRASPTFLARHEHEMWYHLDNEFLERCTWDGIILAPGWAGSKGCLGEKAWFDSEGLPSLLYEEIV